MTTSKREQRLTAKVLELLQKKYNSYISAGYDGPWIMTEENSFTGQTNLICWEEGPFEWAYDASEELELKGAYIEPYNTFTLGVYVES